jgi:hypothetical protein
MYYLDIEIPVDWMLQIPSQYGTGHADDIPLMLGKFISRNVFDNV